MDQRTDEWFEARLGKVTASRISDAMAAPTTAAYLNYQAQLIAETLTGQPYDSYTNAAMQWGTDYEAEARSIYELMTNNDVEEVGFVPHLIIKQSGASPDGLIGEDGQIEIKCPNTATHIKTVTTRKIEKKYRDQMTWQMACTERKWCDFVSYDPRLPVEHNLCIIRFERDDEAIKKMEESVREFLGAMKDKLDQLHSMKGN